ncbi:uncharacterized protein LOC130939750 [Arachis stenosperma]|uniref:uncharacterized protein LOC130939750 n=1 Tax=Arachis stenosperma TaxID=217475 RepID=UPI0025AD9321|nr:uncharacterized protein LOC130939750 [Arachis stenosperma]
MVKVGIICDFDFGLLLLLRDCYFQIGEEVNMNLTITYGFRILVETMIDWIDREVNMNKSYVLFRTYSPVHFRIGSCPPKEERALNTGCYMKYSSHKFYYNSTTIASASGNHGESNLQFGALLDRVNRSKINMAYKILEKATNYFNDVNKLGQGGSGIVYKWGTLIFRASHVFGMMGAALVTSAELTGTFFAAARISGATPPPAHVLSQSIGLQDIGMLLEGIFGATVGTTAPVLLQIWVHDIIIKPKYLVTFTVGYNQRYNINAAMQKASEWDEFEWAKRGIHISAIKQTKRLLGGFPTIDWEVTYKIILGIAKGLAYLHEELHVRIIHRDIKLSNILLDNDFTPKIVDFGLTRLFSEDKSHLSIAITSTL